MSKKNLVAQGLASLEAETAQRASRVPRAPDANRDPALPQQFQPANAPAVAPALVPASFETSTLDGMDEAKQVETLEAAYWDADRAEVRSFQLAKMQGSVLKGELLQLLLERRAHEHRGLTVGDYAESLGIKRQYVYDLIGAAQDIRALAPLIEETSTPVVASQAAVLAPLYKADPEAAGLVLQAAKDSGKLSAASLTEAARDLGLLPPAGTPAPKPAPPAPVSPADVAGRLAFADAYKVLAPKLIEQLVQENPGAVLDQVQAIEAEIIKVQRRVDAAKKAARKAIGAEA
ncbi:hypothetical protein OG444_40560 (plasmid) [Streptomyces sp. NBC_01232]|uniref:hypothetical protein n=1 Tax=Streptomyces sp. NBC_01232 TaxID=2903786 RepID=UPI002E113EBA|nr:hypothetical protein OG444_40560 [Streptomyces sp. NBC_01232]